MLENNPTASTGPSSSYAFANSSENARRKRRPAGTPDPDAEVVSLSPKTLLESDRYVCEICNQGFQRDQNLQMHRRRHKVPWKLLKRESPEVRKRVFVCPEPSCLHHDPCHALGDLVGIKKHFRRKHSNNKQWVCEKCSKGYAVQSDYKAHLKTCGTRGHSCDCGRVFSRVESFIEHQDACNIRRIRPDHLQVTLQQQQQACSSRTASSTSPSSDTNFTNFAALSRSFSIPKTNISPTHDHLRSDRDNLDRSPTDHDHVHDHQHNLELQLLPSSSNVQKCSYYSNRNDNESTHLKLSIGTSSCSTRSNEKMRNDLGGSEELKNAMAEKALAEEARKQGKRQIELAEMEFANAKRIRQAAQAELEKAQILKEQATKKISSTLLEITCHACKQQFQAAKPRNNGATAASHVVAEDQTSLAMSYMSSAITEGEGHL
ncbi:hypothetical protein ACET3Z_032142 [Daucus carota]